MTNPEDTGWVNPHDGKTYYEGDSIPAYIFDSSGALVYGEACVRLNDPGFMGVVMVKHQGRTMEVEYTPTIPVEEIIDWVMPAIEPDEDVYFIGPESPGWRWYYARRAPLASRSTTLASGDDMKV